MVVKINEGSFGQVYKITERNVKNEEISYALKIIPNRSYGIDCFLEILIMCFLNYKFVVKSYDFSIDNENKLSKILMPLADTDLYKFMKKHSKGLKNKTLLLKICWQLSCAIGFLHSRNIIHGDIKLSNVLMKDNDVLLCDFSFACLSLNENHRIYNSETYSYHYRPPEVNSGRGIYFQGRCMGFGMYFLRTFIQ
jgi:serine/threonine protein kinase